MEDKEIFEKEIEEVGERFEFVWGVKSADDIIDSEANMYTLNDIDIVFDKEEENYILDIETAYSFESKETECQYLNSLLKHFTDFMKKKNLDMKYPYPLWMSDLALKSIAKSIPELYTHFKLFVKGYNALYGKEKRK
jgi:hypothetical protein